MAFDGDGAAFDGDGAVLTVPVQHVGAGVLSSDGWLSGFSRETFL